MPLKKPLLLDAILGNARMLVTLDRRGRVHHLFWPQIDFAQHISQLRLGLFLPALGGGVLWLEDSPWEHRQSYYPRAAILRTTIDHRNLGLRVYLDDSVWPEGDILVRRLILENLSSTALPVQVLLYSALDIEESRRYNTVYFDWDQQALLHYRRDCWFAFGADRAVAGYQCGREHGGESAWSDCEDGHLSGRGIENGDTDGAVVWPLGEVAPGGWARLFIFLAAGHSSAEALRGLALARRKGGDRLLEETEAYWQRWLSRARPLNNAHPAVEQLYYRSLMALKLLSDERHGAFIAAPEFDPDRIGCGGYGYCWGRDAAYIATALDEAGYHEEARSFYRWAKRVQDPRGVWYQRYYVDGHLAPSWGLVQIDETGSILWGMARHWLATGDDDFLQEIWPAVARGAAFLADFIHPGNALPLPSIDLWEERMEQSAYAAAAVAAGLWSSAHLARQLGHERVAAGWEKIAQRMKEAVERHLWSERRGRFLRGINLYLSEGEYREAQYRGESVRELPVEAGYPRYARAEDEGLDSSLLGLTIPFGLFSPQHPLMAATAAQIEEKLWVPGPGGLKRYEGDHYQGGNPWVVCTLWLGWYHLAGGRRERAEELLFWAVDHQTELGLLPEQVHRHTGKPAWVVPLSWSHALFVHLALRLFGAER